MLLMFHILAALTSLGVSTYALLRPSRSSFRAGLSLTAITLASGTSLVITTRSPLLPSCLSGLVYLSLATAALTAVKLRLRQLA